jgi:hypothetical protein
MLVIYSSWVNKAAFLSLSLNFTLHASDTCYLCKNDMYSDFISDAHIPSNQVQYEHNGKVVCRSLHTSQ